jgi:peptide deformylase
MILPIYVYGADVLRKKAQEFDVSSGGAREELLSLINDMQETMEKADGVGLAAPQVGKSLRVLIVDGSPLSPDLPEMEGFRRVMVNPELLEESEDMAEFSEGCLSLPDINADVTRPASIKVRYYDQDLNEKEEEFDGFACRMVQHEMDHLDGILFTDRTAPIRRKMLNSRLVKIKTGKVKPHYKIAL